MVYKRQMQCGAALKSHVVFYRRCSRHIHCCGCYKRQMQCWAALKSHVIFYRRLSRHTLFFPRDLSTKKTTVSLYIYANMLFHIRLICFFASTVHSALLYCCVWRWGFGECPGSPQCKPNKCPFCLKRSKIWFIKRYLCVFWRNLLQFDDYCNSWKKTLAHCWGVTV